MFNKTQCVLIESKIKSELEKQGITRQTHIDRALSVHNAVGNKLSARYAHAIATHAKSSSETQLAPAIKHFDQRILPNLIDKNPASYSHTDILRHVNAHQKKIAANDKYRHFIHTQDSFQVAHVKDYETAAKLGCHHGQNPWCISSRDDPKRARSIFQKQASDKTYFIYDRSKTEDTPNSKFALIIKNGSATMWDAADNALNVPMMPQHVASAIKNHAGVNFEYITGKGHEKHTKRHPNGKIAIEENYVNGKLHGTRTSWYKNGIKASEENYVNGKLHGTHTAWHENGKIEFEIPYVNGKRHGKQTSRYENGIKSHEIHYVNEKRHGKQTSWYKNGIKASEENYANGKPHGTHTTWHKNGIKASEENYDNGKSHGTHTAWHENGIKASEENYANGKPHGTHTSWQENGIKSYEARFVNGKRHGKQTSWDENGIKSYEVNFVNGRLKS